MAGPAAITIVTIAIIIVTIGTSGFIIIGTTTTDTCARSHRPNGSSQTLRAAETGSAGAFPLPSRARGFHTSPRHFPHGRGLVPFSIFRE
jgi:hypothetical protein